MIKYDFELRQLQKQYLEVLKSFEPNVEDEQFYFQAVSLIDKCKSFWMSKRLETMIMLSDSSSEQWFLLAGAIYLDVFNNGHYEFGTFGDRNIIDDPIIKMKSFFASSICEVSTMLKAYFTNVVFDTITILEKYSDFFIVISLETLMCFEREESLALGGKVYWDVISSVLHRNIRSLDTLQNEFPTIDLLETALGEEAKGFIFNDISDRELSLHERITKWFETNNKTVALEVSNEIDQFYFASMALMQQAFGLLWECLQFDLYPFIRYEVPLQYFALIAGAYADDDVLKKK